VGCGYLGTAIAADLLARDRQTTVVEKDPAAPCPPGAELIREDFARWDPAISGALFDWVIVACGPNAAAGAESRSAWLAGFDQGLDRLAGAPPRKLALVSCGQVYGQQDGSAVKESSPAAPSTGAGQALLAMEQSALKRVQAGLPVVVLRAGEIYGPGRLPRMDQLIRRETRIARRGHGHLNVIHRDDLVAATLAVLERGRAGEIYNAVDSEPVTEARFYSWLAETLGVSTPAMTAGDAEGTEQGDSMGNNCRISNRRLTMELGCRLKYPDFRQGFTAEIKRLTDAGLLEIEPEPR
jgi:nucleoside-diphosphate-sugar epimerase